MPAIEFGMNVEGIEELQRAFDNLPELMHRNVEYALDRVGEDIHMDAFRMCPVKTGYMRSTIYHKVEHWILTVGVRAPYASFQEFGTRYIQPRYFLTEAFHLNFPNLKHTLDRFVDTAIKAMRWRG